MDTILLTIGAASTSTIVVLILAVTIIPRRRTSRFAAQRRIAELFREVDARYRALVSRREAAETDWHALLRRPVLSYLPSMGDPVLPESQVLDVAADEAREALAMTGSDYRDNFGSLTEDQFWSLPYPSAVMRYELAWDRACARAEEIGLSDCTDETRAAIERMRQLLVIAEDPRGIANERVSAYALLRRMAETLQTHHVFRVSVEAVTELEARENELKALTAGGA